MTVLFSGCFKVLKLEDEAKRLTELTFDASKDVAGFWQSQAVPELKGKVVSFARLMEEGKGDLTTNTTKYGKYSMGDTGELSYTVSVTGVVAEVHTEKKAGYLLIKPDGYDGDMEVRLQVGPVFRGSAVRDSLSMLSYDDYTNQVDWAAVSQNIHKEIQKDVIDALDLASMEGKKVSFIGCFTVSDNPLALITPIELTVEE